jgi:hypothetical protein
MAHKYYFVLNEWFSIVSRMTSLDAPPKKQLEHLRHVWKVLSQLLQEPASCHAMMGNHAAAITAMDMAVHRPLIVTACKAGELQNLHQVLPLNRISGQLNPNHSFVCFVSLPISFDVWN